MVDLLLATGAAQSLRAGMRLRRAQPETPPSSTIASCLDVQTNLLIKSQVMTIQKSRAAPLEPRDRDTDDGGATLPVPL